MLLGCSYPPPLTLQWIAAVKCSSSSLTQTWTVSQNCSFVVFVTLVGDAWMCDCKLVLFITSVLCVFTGYFCVFTGVHNRTLSFYWCNVVFLLMYIAFFWCFFPWLLPFDTFVFCSCIQLNFFGLKRVSRHVRDASFESWNDLLLSSVHNHNPSCLFEVGVIDVRVSD